MEPLAWLRFLAPYQFSPLVVVSTLAVLALWLRGLRAARDQGSPVGAGRRVAFLLGLALCYAVLHTRIDYFAQYVFFIHRLQHLVLHHAGPFLIALAVPWPVLALGLPGRLREWLRSAWKHPSLQIPYRFVQHPVVAPVLFVGLIYFWLAPEIHFDAMLSLPLYHLMNWSMLIDGLLFWWLMLNPKPTGSSAVLSFGTRVLILFLVMPPQIILGSYIALSDADLYDVYAVCGRAWPISPATDQELGGLLTWIPAAMMSVIGILFVISFMLRHEKRMSESGSRKPDALSTGAGRHP
ncbi:MAG TPA: cytochrome c oxidase assembly protein [Arenicellales bacterium]|nr:cytochrome c oxidase assembly protein [Arenicellales bacterium]